LQREAAAGDAFAATTLRVLATKSPTSLNVAFRQIREGAGLSMDECMRMEYRILSRMLVGPDFYEGIRAAVIDKDNAPRWRPATLDAVEMADVVAHFAPLGEKELRL
ncbi:MAG: enoyl-CoA hydratase/isomerase family protein, partial [Rhizobiaceae bacterium]